MDGDFPKQPGKFSQFDPETDLCLGGSYNLEPLSARVYVNLLDSNNQMKLMGVVIKVIDQSLLYYPLKEMGLYTT